MQEEAEKKEAQRKIDAENWSKQLEESHASLAAAKKEAMRLEKESKQFELAEELRISVEQANWDMEEQERLAEEKMEEIEEKADKKAAELKANWLAEQEAYMEVHKLEMERKQKEADAKLAEAKTAHEA